MDIYITIMLFILGIVFGSFYNVVGYRLPKGESIIYPPSHCTNCNSKLTFFELIPIFSFLFLKGRCKHCKQKISWFYPIFEFSTGVLFALSYVVYGMSLECLISIIFISMLLILIISDSQTLIIPDSVLIVCSSLILIVKFFIGGFNAVGIVLLNGVGSFIFMLLLKLLGDFLFKKESMGGGDIKLLGVFGITIGFYMSIVSVFLGAIIALPISLIILKRKKTHILPFGPFLAISAIIIIIFNINIGDIINFFTI